MKTTRQKRVFTGQLLLLAGSWLLGTTVCMGQLEFSRPLQSEKSQRPKPTLHILAIGIDDYSEQNVGGVQMPHLRQAKADARAFSEALRQIGIKMFEVNSQLLLDKQATRANIEAAFEKVAKQARPQDTFIFHFAGLGSLDREATAPKALEPYLLPADIGGPSIKEKGITPAHLKAWLSKIPAQNVLIALDSCESGKGLETFAVGATGSDQPLTSQLLGRSVVFLGVDSMAIENDRIEHGEFTYALLQGLAGEADLGPVDGILTAKELEAYLYGALLKRSNGKSRARTFAIGEDFALGRIDTAKPTEENRGVKSGSAEPKNNNPSSSWKGKNYGLLFGTNIYNDPGWPALSNPIRDAQTLATELKTNYGFEVDLVENPTLAEMMKKLQFYLAEKSYAEDDQLFIFIAGHGAFEESVKMGFIATRDSKAKDLMFNNTALMHATLYRIIDRIPCKHIFLVLDACFGGTYDQIIADKTRSDGDLRYPEASRLEIIMRKKSLKTRLYLTSGGKEYVADGTPGAHSPFAAQLLKALRTYGGDSRILTFVDILQHIEKVKGPQPRWNWFGDYEPSSDFFFVARPTEKK